MHGFVAHCSHCLHGFAVFYATLLCFALLCFAFHLIALHCAPLLCTATLGFALQSRCTASLSSVCISLLGVDVLRCSAVSIWIPSRRFASLCRFTMGTMSWLVLYLASRCFTLREFVRILAHGSAGVELHHVEFNCLAMLCLLRFASCCFALHWFASLSLCVALLSSLCIP